MKTGYRMVVTIFRGTSAGRALSMMANGVQVEYATLEKAREASIEFLDAASAVMSSIDPSIVFGTVAVVDLAGLTVPIIELIRS